MSESAERKEKFTPGPCGFQANCLTVYQEYRSPMGTNAVAKCLEIGDGGGCKTPHEEAIANGYLYAAAPDMYAALKELLACHDEDVGMDDYEDKESVGTQQDVGGNPVDMPLTFGMLRRARAVLAKARGES